MSEPRWPIEDWDTESIRVSIFTPLRYDSRNQYRELWEGASGHIPETVDIRPIDGITRLQGVVGDNNLLVSIQEGRIDWYINPVPPQGRPIDVLTLNRVESVFRILNKALRVSLEVISSVQRLAFAPVLLRVVPDRPTGLNQMEKYFRHLNVDTLDSEDFSYQINRRRASQAVPHARINRLASWTIQEGGNVSFSITPSGVPAISDSNPFTVRRLEMDVNTTEETTDIPTSKGVALFHELVGMASEIANEGDIP